MICFEGNKMHNEDQSPLMQCTKLTKPVLVREWKGIRSYRNSGCFSFGGNLVQGLPLADTTCCTGSVLYKFTSLTKYWRCQFRYAVLKCCQAFVEVCWRWYKNLHDQYLKLTMLKLQLYRFFCLKKLFISINHKLLLH